MLFLVMKSRSPPSVGLRLHPKLQALGHVSSGASSCTESVLWMPCVVTGRPRSVQGPSVSVVAVGSLVSCMFLRLVQSMLGSAFLWRALECKNLSLLKSD